MKLVSTMGPLYLPPFEEIAFAPDNRLLATRHTEAKCIRLWNTQTGEQIACWPAEQPHVSKALAFSPDGKALAWWSSSDKIEVRELPAGRMRARLSLRPPDASPWYLREHWRFRSDWPGWGPIHFTPDSKFLIAVVMTETWHRRSKSLHSNVFLWDVITGQEYLRLPGQAFAVGGTTDTDYTLATLGSSNVGEGEVSLLASWILSFSDKFQFPINYWNLKEMRSELEASGLAPCMHAPNADSGERLQSPYPLNLLVDRSRAAGNPWLVGVAVAVVFLLGPACVAAGCLSLLILRKRQRRVPSSRTLTIFTGVGLLIFILGFYQLITVLNTPGWTWLELRQDLASIFASIWASASLIWAVGRAYRLRQGQRSL
jgi:hypothetical protein